MASSHGLGCWVGSCAALANGDKSVWWGHLPTGPRGGGCMIRNTGAVQVSRLSKEYTSWGTKRALSFRTGDSSQISWILRSTGVHPFVPSSSALKAGNGWGGWGDTRCAQWAACRHQGPGSHPHNTAPRRWYVPAFVLRAPAQINGARGGTLHLRAQAQRLPTPGRHWSKVRADVARMAVLRTFWPQPAKKS